MNYRLNKILPNLRHWVQLNKIKFLLSKILLNFGQNKSNRANRIYFKTKFDPISVQMDTIRLEKLQFWQNLAQL